MGELPVFQAVAVGTEEGGVGRRIILQYKGSVHVGRERDKSNVRYAAKLHLVGRE